MVDTQRDTVTLLSLLADNTSREISPQDLRDALVSVLGGFGAFSLKDGATPQTFSTSPSKFTGWSAISASNGAAPNILTKELTVALAGWYLVFAPLTCSGPAGRTFEARIRLNDVETNFGHRGTFPASGTLTLPLIGLVIAGAANDRISVYGEADQASTDVVGID